MSSIELVLPHVVMGVFLICERGRALTRQQGFLPACDRMELSRAAVKKGTVNASLLLSSPATSINLYLVKHLLLIRL